MACAVEHATFNLITVTVATAIVQHKEGRSVDGAALAMGGAAALLPSLPDLLEPAVNPNHRKFFHSVTFAVGMAYAIHRVYKWEAQDTCEKLVRIAMLIGGAAYLGHLARDAFTAKSLPLV